MSRKVDKEEHSPALTDVLKTMKSILPTSCSVDADALDLVKKCVSRFISSVSSEAIARSIHKESTALTSDEILQSLECIGYHDYKVPLELYLNKFAAHSVMKRPPEVVKAARKSAKYVNSTVTPKVPKAKPAARPPAHIQYPAYSNRNANSASSSLSPSAAATHQPVSLPAILTASGRSLEQKMEDAINFAIRNPNVSIRKLCEVVGIPKIQFKAELAAHLEAMKFRDLKTTRSIMIGSGEGSSSSSSSNENNNTGLMSDSTSTEMKASDESKP